MPLHIVKLCVGADSVEDLANWQKHFERPVCGTRMRPKKDAEVLAGGSLYWVIKGLVCVRQRIVEIGDVVDEHGPRVGLYLGRELIRTIPQPRRAFQGWRYLEANDAPADLDTRADGDLPDELRAQLAEIGVL
jgi:hypothetical protein